MRDLILLLAVVFLVVPGLGRAGVSTGEKGEEKGSIDLRSPAFREGEMIPAKYTCNGADVSPPISWSAVPDGAKSLALICDDPDAPVGTWVHWVIYNLPPATTGLPENVPTGKVLENGARQGTNDFKRIGYGGPCPPSGTHRYDFRLYVLDTVLDLGAGANRPELLEAMEGHIRAEGHLMGKYGQ